MKRKIKQTLATILALTLMLCTLSACNSNSKNSPVGKWYNSQGKCLDVRSDGTYELENDYGTGSWKYLDDGKTIEFKDFYGSTIKTKAGKDKKGNYIVLESWGTFYKDSQKNTNKTNNASQISYTLSYYSRASFSDNRAVIEYENETGKEYTALIDINGKILYNSENASPYVYYSPQMDALFPGIACIVLYEQNSGSIDTYQIINKSGKIIASSKDGKFDKVLAYGDGLALVYKDKSDVNGTHNYYGIIDSSGAWKQPLKEITTSTEAIYVGCGMFQFKRNVGKNILYNANTGKYTAIKGDTNYNYFVTMNFINDIAYYRNDNNIFSIKTNFETQKMDDYERIIGDCILKRNQNHLSFYCPAVNKVIELEQYEPHQLSSLETSDDYIFLKLHGKDGYDYFTTLDGNGRELFEPIRYDGNNVAFSDDLIAFRKDSQYNIIDLQGKLISENLNYDSIHAFNNGIAVATIGNDVYYINSKGKKVLTTLHK